MFYWLGLFMKEKIVFPEITLYKMMDWKILPEDFTNSIIYHEIVIISISLFQKIHFVFT